jgi:hypothetical protein
MNAEHILETCEELHRTWKSREVPDKSSPIQNNRQGRAIKLKRGEDAVRSVV